MNFSVLLVEDREGMSYSGASAADSPLLEVTAPAGWNKPSGAITPITAL